LLTIADGAGFADSLSSRWLQDVIPFAKRRRTTNWTGPAGFILRPGRFGRRRSSRADYPRRRPPGHEKRILMNQTEHFKLTYRMKRRFQWLSAMGLAALTLTTSLTMAQTPDAGLPGKGIKVRALQSPAVGETSRTMLVDAALEKLG
jgi:hypothetical protein